ncbi:MAG: pilus motility taxis protein HmpF [Gloeocapsa sp. UFS-A4-WI-NPMV-4B04]|nr:pilus motility taxis protein HmpF [Gloeocapsa sp. UFS-A4-WI-NPMV-4B04]
MLYLAEVQKQKSGFMGAGKAEIKLLAFQRPDQSWNPVPGEEAIAAEEANNLNAGTLVLADLNANRQVQRIQEAGRPLVSILQNFSRTLEKSKRQEEEIEQWKQSLTYQSQELNRRNMEMEARLEQLQQMESDFNQLEAQRQEIETGREKMAQLQQEIERNRRELEGAWEHLRGEQRRLNEQQTQLQQAPVLDEVQTQQIQELLTRLSNGVAPTETVWEQLNFALEMVATQQGVLGEHWQQFEQQHGYAQQQQEEVERQAETLQNSFSGWQQAQNSWEQASAQLKGRTATLSSKQDYVRALTIQVRNQEELYQQIYSLAEASGQVDISDKVDLEALEKMPLDQLQQIVQDLQQDLQNASRFVNDQEEELKFQQQTIDELQAKLNQATGSERTDLETELADEQNSYEFLNETLVGQRQNLRSRKAILNQHQGVMWQRQGVDPNNGQEDNTIDLKPILAQIEAQQQQQKEELQKLEQEIEQIRFSLEQEQGMIDQQAQEQETKRLELQSIEQNLLSLRATVAECWGRIHLYQEMLQPVQDSLNEMRQKLEAIADALNHLQQTGNDQLQTVEEMRSSLVNILPNPEVAVF